jgi:hypothetical protein
MEFTYRKNDNSNLFSSVVNPDGMNVTDPQNYVPLYHRFFSLSDKNYDSINLNHVKYLDNVGDMKDSNIFECEVVDDKGTRSKNDVFFKYSPLLDPVKYMMGKYDTNDENLMKLPKFDTKNGHAKIRDPNNAAYVDSFFTYLTSQLYHSHGFVHALDFYGSFLANKKDFRVNIADDVEYLNDSEFFHTNRSSLFEVDNTYANGIFNFNTRKNKEKLNLETIENDNVLELSNLEDLSVVDDIFVERKDDNNQDIVNEADLVFSFDIKEAGNNDEDSSSECSSRSSVTDGESEECIEEDECTSESGFSTASEDMLFARINCFPVQVIALEKCENTLDSLIVDKGEDMKDLEWGSMMIQVIMMLISYQKTYGVTHNDLHTNNIMYVPTDKPYLYYRADGKYYKVPTFGRLYKIIDFGRAIYKFRGNVVCSDSYHSKGDAATQYNFEPYMNEDKPILEPNFSFDLCRLGCSLLDFFIDELEESPKHPNLAAKRMIMDWCMDDKGRNVLYKQDGEERYPNFKLYKMIARTVHNHVPLDELRKGYFERFVVNKKKINKGAKIMNIDDLPCYM